MSAWKAGVNMAGRNRASFKKREREMAKKVKKQDKAERKADRASESDPKETIMVPVDKVEKVVKA